MERGEFEVTGEEKVFLLESLEQARRGDWVDGWKLLDEIRACLVADQPARR